MLMSVGSLPTLEVTEPITPGLVNQGWQFYFNRRLPMVRNSAALIAQPVADWDLRRSWALVAALGDDRATVVMEFCERETPAARSHVLVSSAIMPVRPGDEVIPLLMPDAVAAIIGGAGPELLDGIKDRARRAANRAIGAVWVCGISELEFSMPGDAEIKFSRDRNRTPPQRPHAICGGVSIRLPQL